ncbi:MAG TPA: hypothetical protein VK980_13470 [Sphingomonas sp.]|nr:hypothetical protein [Sphingomonas sp.]
MLASLLIAAALQAAAPAAPACAAEGPPPPGFEAWTSIGAITTGPITVGTRTGVKLAPAATAHLALPPEHKPADGSYAGVYHFTVSKAATYSVALDTPAWIDVIGNGTAVKSTAHRERPNCSSIRKAVDFPLTPGDYSLQLSGAKAETMTLLIVAR